MFRNKAGHPSDSFHRLAIHLVVIAMLCPLFVPAMAVADGGSVTAIQISEDETNWYTLYSTYGWEGEGPGKNIYYVDVGAKVKIRVQSGPSSQMPFDFQLTSSTQGSESIETQYIIVYTFSSWYSADSFVAKVDNDAKTFYVQERENPQTDFFDTFSNLNNWSFGWNMNDLDNTAYFEDFRVADGKLVIQTKNTISSLANENSAFAGLVSKNRVLRGDFKLETYYKNFAASTDGTSNWRTNFQCRLEETPDFSTGKHVFFQIAKGHNGTRDYFGAGLRYYSNGAQVDIGGDDPGGGYWKEMDQVSGDKTKITITRVGDRITYAVGDTIVGSFSNATEEDLYITWNPVCYNAKTGSINSFYVEVPQVEAHEYSADGNLDIGLASWGVFRIDDPETMNTEYFVMVTDSQGISDSGSSHTVTVQPPSGNPLALNYQSKINSTSAYYHLFKSNVAPVNGAYVFTVTATGGRTASVTDTFESDPISPVNHESIRVSEEGTTPVISWDSVSDAAGYRVNIYDSTGSLYYFTYWTKANSIKIRPGALQPYSQYHCRINAAREPKCSENMQNTSWSYLDRNKGESFQTWAETKYPCEGICFDDGILDKNVAPWSDQPESEIAVRFTNSSVRGRLEKATFFVSAYNEPTTPFDVRIYSVSGDFPDQQLNGGTISASAPHGNTWVEVDLSSKNIYIDNGQSFFVSMLWKKAPGKDGCYAQFLGLDTTGTIQAKTCWKGGGSTSWTLLQSGHGGYGNTMVRAVIQPGSGETDPVINYFKANPTQIDEKEFVLFTCDAYDPDGGAVSYRFEPGDGSSQNDNDGSYEHLYNSPGTYHAKCIVTDDEGHSVSSGTIPIEVRELEDSTPPSTISNLAATAGDSSGTVKLTWTAPGDDGTGGTAHHYEVKHHSQAITGTNWNQATTYAQAWTPQSGGSAESRTVGGLTPGQTYYFAVKGVDEAGNVGGVSNSPSAKSGASEPFDIAIEQIVIYIRDLEQLLLPPDYNVNPYATPSGYYTIPYATAGHTRLHLTADVINRGNSSVQLKFKALFISESGANFDVIGNYSEIINPGGSARMHLPGQMSWKDTPIVGLNISSFAGFDLEIYCDAGDGYVLMGTYTGTDQSQEGGIVKISGWNENRDFTTVAAHSPYILHLVKHNDWDFDALCEHYELSPPLESFMEHASVCLSQIWEDYVDYEDKDNQEYDDDVEGIHVAESLGESIENQKKKFNHMKRIYRLLTGDDHSTLDETDRAVDAIKKGIACLVDDSVAQKHQQNVKTCFAVWDACWDQCEKDADCKIKDTKAEYRERMYKNQEFPYDELIEAEDCDACEYDNGWWLWSQSVDFFFVSNDDLSQDAVELDKVMSLSITGTAAVVEVGGQRGILIGAEAGATNIGNGVLSLATFLLATPVSKFSIWMRDCGGETVLTAHDAKGATIQTLYITSADLQRYDIENVGHIHKVEIQSSCAWVAEIHYEAIGAETNRVFVQGNGDCGDNYPCFDSVQNGLDWAMDGADIFVGKGKYLESLVIGDHKQLNLTGGWDAKFLDEQGHSQVRSMIIKDASVIVRGLKLGE